MSDPHRGVCLDEYLTPEGDVALCGREKGHEGAHGLCRIARRAVRFMTDDEYFDRWAQRMEREIPAREASSSGGRCW